MSRYCVIENGHVASIIEADADFAASIGAVPATDVKKGDAWDGSVFTPVAAPVFVPASVTMRQARLALLGAGLLAGVQTAIDAIQDATTKAATQITWDHSSEVLRDNAVLAALAAALNLTSQQVDNLFIAAAKL